MKIVVVKFMGKISSIRDLNYYLAKGTSEEEVRKKLNDKKCGYILELNGEEDDIYDFGFFMFGKDGYKKYQDADDIISNLEEVKVKFKEQSDELNSIVDKIAYTIRDISFLRGTIHDEVIEKKCDAILKLSMIEGFLKK